MACHIIFHKLCMVYMYTCMGSTSSLLPFLPPSLLSSSLPPSLPPSLHPSTPNSFPPSPLLSLLPFLHHPSFPPSFLLFRPPSLPLSLSFSLSPSLPPSLICSPSDPGSNISVVSLALGHTPRDTLILPWREVDMGGYVEVDVVIPDGVPTWVKLRARNNGT